MASEKIILSGVIILIVLLFGSLAYFIMDTLREKDCLEPIAKKYCENNNMTFFSLQVAIDPQPLFYCTVDDRHAEVTKFLFTEEELAQC